jgi:hypothetical protein
VLQQANKAGHMVCKALLGCGDFVGLLAGGAGGRVTLGCCSKQTRQAKCSVRTAVLGVGIVLGPQLPVPGQAQSSGAAATRQAARSVRFGFWDLGCKFAVRCCTQHKAANSLTEFSTAWPCVTLANRGRAIVLGSVVSICVLLYCRPAACDVAWTNCYYT